MSKTTNKFLPEVSERAVRPVLDHEQEHFSCWAAIESIAGKIGCVPQSLNGWIKKAEICRYAVITASRHLTPGMPPTVRLEIRASGLLFWTGI